MAHSRATALRVRVAAAAIPPLHRLGRILGPGRVTSPATAIVEAGASFGRWWAARLFGRRGRCDTGRGMGTVMHQMPMFRPAKEKIVEIILFLIEEARDLGHELTQYDVVKTLFVADKDHLDEHGRPVTFDNYAAMANGPVGSAAYDMLKPGYDWAQFGLASAPWRRVDRPGSTTADFLPADRKSNRRKMSPSDREALLRALSLVKAKGFGGVKKMTHGSEAYRKAWRDDGGKAFPMDPRLIPRNRDDDRIADLVYASNRHR